ncbi:MAG: TIGR03016 family PEP-CTERM system-associated outer membrane protein [Pelovirga sp.]
MKPTKLLTIALVTSIGLLFSPAAWSAVEVTPRFTLSQEYNDNIFLRESNRESDWITTVEPGLNLDYDQRSLEMSLDYSLRYRFYNSNTSEDQDKFRDVQRGAADLLFFGGRPFTLRATGTISRETLNERDRDLEFNDTVDRSTVYRLSVTPEYRLRLGSTASAVFGYTFNLVDYADRAGDDYIEHVGRTTIEKNISANLDVWGRYQYTEHDNDDNLEDFDRHEASVGGRYQLGARTSLSAMVGRSKVEYDSGLDAENTIWSTDLTYMLTSSVTLALLYNQDYQVTATDGLSRSREARFSTIFDRPLTSVTTEVFWRELDFVRDDRVDESYGVNLGLSRQLSQAFTFGTDAGYERADNRGPDEKFHRYTFGANLGFDYRRFVTTLGYRYRLNDSDISGNDYYNNIVTLTGSIRF